MTREPGIAKLIVFALLCVALSYAVGYGLEFAARGTGEVPRLLRETPAHFPYGISVILCLLLGWIAGMWRRRAPVTGVLAAVTCFAAPYGASWFTNGVSCLRWWECLR